MVNLSANQIQKPNGAAVAAILAACFALLVLGVTVLASELNPWFNNPFLLNVGKAWIPNAQGIGPYSGKETFLLGGWAVSWIGLHLALRRRNVNTRVMFGLASLMLVVAVLLVWPPVWHWLGAP